MTTELPKIRITLKPGEGIKVEAVNFTGSSCTEATEALLNMGESSTQLKPEFYETDPSIDLLQKSNFAMPNQYFQVLFWHLCKRSNIYPSRYQFVVGKIRSPT